MTDVQTTAVDPFEADFRQWSSDLVAAQAGAAAVRPPGDGAAARADQLTSLFAYRNYRAGVDWNTCGQAAIATIADFHGRDPYQLPRQGNGHWDDGQAIDAVIAGGFGPDVVFGLGSSGGRIRDALQSYGLTASVGYSGFASAGWQDQWATLKAYVSYRLPVPVLVDVGALGGSWWTAHWPVVYRIADGQVYMAAAAGSAVVDEATFLRAWHCWFLPYGFNHCAVYAY
ncbi:hypothetical protein [Paractinoplanes atraurantiacus]|uniref:Peptidase_C39 like family protein n=1 Tax=Paractinoplanes atraurantiacus TaxID=1036182 RepID=A0A285HTJ7_9ACTN|nr:hypothetical protein [Actinoplanes atraurantiacus]SNY39068.1 hypothetical protein SAMN05421748_105303 [Actinoplanes atraurantiacus]